MTIIAIEPTFKELVQKFLEVSEELQGLIRPKGKLGTFVGLKLLFTQHGYCRVLLYHARYKR